MSGGLFRPRVEVDPDPVYDPRYIKSKVKLATSYDIAVRTANQAATKYKRANDLVKDGSYEEALTVWDKSDRSYPRRLTKLDYALLYFAEPSPL